MWCHYCDNNNHDKVNFRAIAKFKQQKKAQFEVKAGSGKKTLVILFEKSPEKTASNKNRKAEYLFSRSI
jgi:hypothetical protein